MLTLLGCGVCAAVICALTGEAMNEFVGKVCEVYCPEKLAVNQPPTRMVHLTDELAAVFERPWWEGGPTPR